MTHTSKLNGEFFFYICWPWKAIMTHTSELNGEFFHYNYICWKAIMTVERSQMKWGLMQNKN